MRIKTFTNLLLLISVFSASAQKGLIFNLDIKTEPTPEITKNETGIGFQFFKTINAKSKLTNTFTYKKTTVDYPLENYVIKNYATQNNVAPFNSFVDDFEFSRQIAEKTKLNLEITPTANFESNFNVSDITILGGLEVCQTLDKNNSITIGIKRTTLFGKPTINPTFSFYHQINKEAYMKLGFPNTEISYSNTIRNKFSFTNTFSGSSYNLNQPIVSDDLNSFTKVGFSQIETALEYERNIEANWFLSLKGGYGFNRELKLSNDTGTSEFNQTIANGCIFSISIKYKH
jgi:hypothetical protein